MDARAKEGYVISRRQERERKQLHNFLNPLKHPWFLTHSDSLLVIPLSLTPNTFLSPSQLPCFLQHFSHLYPLYLLQFSLILSNCFSPNSFSPPLPESHLHKIELCLHC